MGQVTGSQQAWGSLALAACDKSKLERSPSRFTIVKVPWAAMEIAPILKEERLVEDWL